MTQNHVMADDTLGGVMREFRMVERKARIGDRIVVTLWDTTAHLGGSRVPRVGETFTVKRVDRDGDVWYVEERDFDCVLRLCEYRVLERIETSTNVPDATDVLTSRLASMATSVVTLETEMASLKRELASIRADVAGVVKQRFETPSTAADEIAAGIAKLAGGTRKKTLTRDEIVERAKRDVAERFVDGSYGVGHVVNGHAGHNKVRFIVNRANRTIEAILSLAYIDDGFSEIRRRGLATCAPDDVFNVRLGKAIALRRALQIDVPDEYLYAPKPTDIRVGDVVETFRRDRTPFKTFTVVGIRGSHLYDERHKYVSNGYFTPFEPQYGDRVIDDSGRYETEGDAK